MARNTFGGGVADYAYSEADGVAGFNDLVQARGGAVVTFWNLREGGVQFTDLLDQGGGSITQITTSNGSDGYATGQIPQFSGPDEVWELWASANGGSRFKMTATNVGTRLGPAVVANGANLSSHIAATNPHGTRVQDLSDANAASPANGQFLGWDTGTSRWRPMDVAGLTGTVHTTGDESITGRKQFSPATTSADTVRVVGIASHTGKLVEATPLDGVGGLLVDANGVVWAIAHGATHIPLKVKAAAAQSARMAEFQDSTGTPVSWVDSDGSFRSATIGNLFPFSQTGTLAITTGKGRIYNDTGKTLAVKAVRSSVNTPPTGAAILVDININGTTIFPGGTGRPSIAIGANTSGRVAISSVNLADGSYLTVDVDQVGSSTPGADLTVQIWAV